MENKNNEIGMGLAGFLLSMSTIQILIKGNVLRAKEIDQIIANSREFLNLPGLLSCHPETLDIVEQTLKVAEKGLRKFLPPSA